MALPRFARQTITVLRAPTVQDHGSAVRDWANAVPHEVTGCSVQPGAGAEENRSREAVMAAYVVFAPPGADVLATDKVRIDAGEYKVIGEPQRWESPSGRLSHVQLQLERWEG